MWFPNRSDTNQAVQSQKMARDWILDLERRGLVLSVLRSASLYSHMQIVNFLMRRLNNVEINLCLFLNGIVDIPSVC